MKQFLTRLSKFMILQPVVWSCVFLVAFLSPQFSTLFVAKPSLEGAVRLKSEELKNIAPDLDYLFLGSSTCYCGIDPHALGESRSFSLCSSAQKIGNSLEVFDIALEFTSPKVTIVDIYPELWQGDHKSVESSRDWVINSPFYNHIEADDLYTYILQFYHEISDAFGISHEPYPAPPSDEYMGLGFVARNNTPLTESPCTTAKTYEMSDALASKLLQLDSKTELVLLIPPVLCETSWKLPESLGHLRVIDGGEWPESKNQAMYYDDHHLVSEGARLYSKWLSEQLN